MATTTIIPVSERPDWGAIPNDFTEADGENLVRRGKRYENDMTAS